MKAYTARGTPPLESALSDLLAGLRCWELWGYVGWNEIRQRYRRSLIGPFWITLSMGIMIGGLGAVFANLWGTPWKAYVPYLAVSLVFWSLISALLLDGCQIFISAGGTIRQLRAPMSLYVYQMLWRNLIIFAHHVIIFLAVIPLSDVHLTWHSLLVIPGFVLLVLNGTWASLALGMLCARYRDVPQIMQNIVQILFFLTPVIWTGDRLSEYGLVLQLNPFYHLLELVRAPLLGQIPAISSWLVGSGLALVGGFSTCAAFGRCRSRIAYWI